MPKMNGAEATRQILLRHPHVRIIIVTSAPASRLAETAIAAGAVTCLPKTADCNPLITAIRG